MIHLEKLLDSRFRSIGILRIYSGIPQNQPAFDYRLDFDFALVLMWYPSTRQATLKALRIDEDKRPRWTVEKSWELADFIHTHTGCTRVTWERASGKKLTVYREGPSQWRLLPLSKSPGMQHRQQSPPPIEYQLDIS